MLQDEVFSGRSLVFTKGGVYWECIGMVASEESAEGAEWSHAATMLFKPNGRYDIAVKKAYYGRQFKKILLEVQRNDSVSVNCSARGPR